jgi:nucleoside-diphosphate kinase
MSGHLTLALIKPHAVLSRNVGKIIARIEEEGFALVFGKETQLTRYGAREFYQEHKGKEFFDNLVNVMSKGPVWALVLAKPGAVEEWRKVIGATNPAEAEVGTIRHEFGDHTNLTNNAVHGSATDHDAKREINFFFSQDLREAAKVQSLDNELKLPPEDNRKD